MSGIELEVFPNWDTEAGYALVLTWRYPKSPAPDYRPVLMVSTGLGDWRRLEEEKDGVYVEGDNSFLFKPTTAYRRVESLNFRVVAQIDGVRYDSPSIGLFHQLRPHEFATVRQILAQELKDMQMGNGHSVYLCKPRTYGDPADSFDPTTGQFTNPSADLSGFGQRYRGGYFQPPLKTWCRFNNTQTATVRDTEGKGMHDDTKVQARLFAFPLCKSGDLLIDTETNLRYVVQNLQTYSFRGVVPIMSDAVLEQLPLSHIKYKFIPEL